MKQIAAQLNPARAGPSLTASQLAARRRLDRMPKRDTVNATTNAYLPAISWLSEQN